MDNLQNLNHDKISEYTENKAVLRVFAALDKFIGVIRDPDHLDELIKMDNRNESIIAVYPSICLVLAEARALIDPSIDVDELSYQYMTRIKNIIENHFTRLSCYLYGGLADLGLGVHALYKTTGYYKKFLDSLNKLIINTTLEEIKTIKGNLNNLKIQSFDTIRGLAGVTGYLLLFKGEPEVDKVIKEALSFFVMMTKDREVLGYKVPSYYISSDNQFSDLDKKHFPKGNFNLGLSHGITGPLVVLALALNEGIEVEGQRDAIRRILEDLKVFSYVDEKGQIYWPGRISFDDYIVKKVVIQNTRASWCYGTPGIARAMYIAGQSIQDSESIDLAKRALDGLCLMKKEDWKLTSPTLCHGYSGLLAVIQTMHRDTEDINYQKCEIGLMDIVLGFFREDLEFGFYDIEYGKTSDGEAEVTEEERVSFLTGNAGIMLTLLSSIKPVETNWMRHLLII